MVRCAGAMRQVHAAAVRKLTPNRNRPRFTHVRTAMPLVGTAEVRPRSPIPRWSGRFVDSQKITVVFWHVDEGAQSIHEHHHVQEELWSVIEDEIVVATPQGVEASTSSCRSRRETLSPTDLPGRKTSQIRTRRNHSARSCKYTAHLVSRLC